MPYKYNESRRHKIPKARYPELLDQVDAGIASMTADGAYDSMVVHEAVAERHPEAAVIIPPR